MGNFAPDFLVTAAPAAGFHPEQVRRGRGGAETAT